MLTHWFYYSPAEQFQHSILQRVLTSVVECQPRLCVKEEEEEEEEEEENSIL